ncbi:LOW QUALITY PROTEIN: hypothetical protein HID58_060025 [Brassica napus]|uniref:Small ribosomal subunit protein eS4 N-terminal domain-containing protein n=1 Tax=Brassica napus TaxID=3708 RepID=A0ABQ7ZUI7_BRANA|nr:LOW QUALITY PROTEIN: hypothetical protein HID58_060025 [Brassica napus]
MKAGRLCISFAKAIGLKKHMKRLNAPKHWMLGKLGVRTKGHLFPEQTIKLDLEEKKIVEFIKLDFGNVVMVTGGRNRGRVGVIRNRTKLKGSFETTTTYKTQQDMTRLRNVFTLGKGSKRWGVKLTKIEEARKRLASQQTA